MTLYVLNETSPKKVAINLSLMTYSRIVDGLKGSPLSVALFKKLPIEHGFRDGLKNIKLDTKAMQPILPQNIEDGEFVSKDN